MGSCVFLDQLAQLERLLDDRLDDGQRQAVEDHVEECLTCQQTLEELAADRGEAPARRHPSAAPGLAGPDASFLRSLKDRGPPFAPDARDEESVFSDPIDTGLAGSSETKPTARPPRLPAIAGFRVVREIGQGGMGVVYEAIQEPLGRHVALKVLQPHGRLDATQLARFRLEARAAAGLHHANIVPVFAVGEEDGVPYYAMQFIRGQGIDTFLDDLRRLRHKATSVADRAPDGRSHAQNSGQLSQPRAVYFRTVARIGAHVAGALAYAHAQGICHRDIKPSNLLLDAGGVVWVADFGLAKAQDGESAGLTRTGDIVGTLRYMAPERFNGWADARTDVYSLGATLYEMLTLRPAFVESDRLKLIDLISSGAVPRPRSIDPTIPRDLETIVLKAMAREPVERYVSAHALGEDLDRFLADRTILARRSSPRERAWRWCRRNPIVAALTALTATLTALVAMISTVAAVVSFRQLDRTTAAERQTRMALGNSLLTEGAALQRTGLIGQRFDSLDRLARSAKILGGDLDGRSRLPEIRNHAIAAMGLTDLRAVWQRDHGDVHSFSIDAAMEQYAVAERSGTVVVYRRDDHEELLRLPIPKQPGIWHVETMFSPDRELLAADYVGAGGGELLQVWHLARRELLVSLQKRAGGMSYRGAFTPDSQRFLYSPPEGGIAIWDRGERKVVRRLPLDFAPHHLAIDPEGRQIAVNNADLPARVAILELESGRTLANWRSQAGNMSLAWSADGQLLAAGSYTRDARIYLWNVRREELASFLPGHSGAITAVHFAHSGYLLATTGWDYRTRLWDAVSGELLANAAGEMLGFARDDRRLAMKDAGTIGIWEIASSDTCRTLHPAMTGNRGERRDTSVVLSGSFSPDGLLLATGDADGTHLWEAHTGQKVAHLKEGARGNGLFHPDGRSLIISDQWGVFRWPISPDPEHGADAVRVGPGELIREVANEEWNATTWLPDQRTLAIIENAKGRVWLVDSSHPRPVWSRAPALDSGENRRMTSVAVSPDGCWLAVGGWKEAGVRVWDLRKRRLERVLRPSDPSVEMSFMVAFSPDGRWLISSTAESSGHMYHFWRTGTWDLDRRIELERHGGAFRPPVFTGDGRLMAMGIAPDQVLLADAATGHELARFTTLQSVHPAPLAFSADGTKLAATNEQKTVLVWDVRRIRDQLATLGLDWDAPSFPPSSASALDSAAEPVPPPRSVRVVGRVLDPQARKKAERALMDRKLGANPDDADALIQRGWLSLTEGRLPEAIADLDHLHRLHPEYPDVDWMLSQAHRGGSNPAGAIEFYGRVLERAPEDEDSRFQRGLIALALGRPQQAVDDFSRVLAAHPTNDNFRYHRARALNRLRRYKDALSETDVLFTRHPNDFALFQLRGTAYDALGEREPARLAWEKAHSYLPNNPPELNRNARIMAIGPLVTRDPERAVVLARQAVALAPEDSRYQNTLGVGLYGVGRYSEAIKVLEQSRPAGQAEPDPVDLFFLAMAHHGLGNRAQARSCFNWAVQWLDSQKNLLPQKLQELAAFRAEAEAVLAFPGADLPADVFAPP